VRHQERRHVVERIDLPNSLCVGQLLQHLDLVAPLLEAQSHRGQLDGFDFPARQRVNACGVVAEMLIGLVHPAFCLTFDGGVPRR
jgi:hypothetical protein